MDFLSHSAEYTLSVRPDRQYDPHYRYKMPPLDSATDNRSKQRKTHLCNSAAVARNIFRPEAWLVKFMALELSTDSSNSAGDAYLTGHHEPAMLQALVFRFVGEYVQCKCGSPETLLYVEGKKRRKVCRLRCHSCGRDVCRKQGLLWPATAPDRPSGRTPVRPAPGLALVLSARAERRTGRVRPLVFRHLGRDGRATGQEERMLSLFAAQPMPPELCPMLRGDVGGGPVHPS